MELKRLPGSVERGVGSKGGKRNRGGDGHHDHVAVDAKAPKQQRHEADKQCAGHRVNCDGKRGSEQILDNRGDGQRGIDHLDQQVATKEDEDVGEHRHDGAKGFGQKRRHAIGHLDGDALGLAEARDLDGDQGNDDGGKQALRTQIGAGDRLEHGLISKLVVGRRRRGDQEHHQRGHTGVKLGHLVGARQVIGDCERHDHRQYAHRHVERDEQRKLIGRGKIEPRAKDGPEPALRHQVGRDRRVGDDHKDGRDQDEADRAHKALLHGGKVALGAAEIGNRGQFFLKQGHELFHGRLLAQQRLGECQHVGGVAHAVVLCGDDRGRLTAPLLDGVELVGHLRPQEQHVIIGAGLLILADTHRIDIELDAVLLRVFLEFLHQNACRQASCANKKDLHKGFPSH